MMDAILTRRAIALDPGNNLSSFGPAKMTEAQARADALVSSFVDHTTDGYSLAAMVGGGLVYRLGRMGTLAIGSRLVGATHASPLHALVRLGSVGIGFTGEVFAFEAGQRALRVGIGGADPNLIRWAGENGLGRGLVGAAITLGSLKGAGVFVQGQNPVIQHLFQDSAMVLAHNVSDRIFTRRGDTCVAPTIAEQFVEAEATLWQMNAGMSLVHAAFPGLGQAERSLDLAARVHIFPRPPLTLRGGEEGSPPLRIRGGWEGIRSMEPLLAAATEGNIPLGTSSKPSVEKPVPGTATRTEEINPSDELDPNNKEKSGGRGPSSGDTTLLTLTAMGTGLATFLAASDLHAALEAVGGSGKDLLQMGLTAFAVAGIFSKAARVYKRWRDRTQGVEEVKKTSDPEFLRDFARRHGWDYPMMMGRLLRDAPPTEVRAFLEREFPKNPMAQLTWLEDYRIAAGREILTGPEAFLFEATKGLNLPPEEMFKLRVKAAEVLHGAGEKKLVVDYLHRVFSDLTEGVSWQELFPQGLEGEFLLDPPEKETFFKLLAKDIYPYFLTRLDPQASVSMRLILEYHERKGKELPKDLSFLKDDFERGWRLLFNSELLTEQDRIRLAEELVKAHGEPKMIFELHRVLGHLEMAALAARLLDRFDPEWDRPLREEKPLPGIAAKTEEIKPSGGKKK